MIFRINLSIFGGGLSKSKLTIEAEGCPLATRLRKFSQGSLLGVFLMSSLFFVGRYCEELLFS